MQFDRGYLSPYFINQQQSQTAEFEKPQSARLIFLARVRAAPAQRLAPLLE
jgi:chaperonin GroEL